MTEATLVLNTPADTAKFGKALGRLLRSGDVLALVGDLGAGKTTLTQALAQGMGIIMPVSSPTFALMQEYPGRLPLFHCDPYRLDNPEDVLGFGFEEYFERKGVVVVEWADLIVPLLPPDHLTLTLTIQEMAEENEEQSRLLEIAAHGARSGALLSELLALPEITDYWKTGG